MMLNKDKKNILDYVARAVNNGDKLSEKIRPIRQVGSGKYSQYSVDHTRDYTEFLEKYKLAYEIGNDSPRGGQLGKYIQVKIDRRNTFIKSLIK